MSATSHEDASRVRMAPNSVSLASNRRETPMSHFPSSDQDFEAPSTGRSSIGSASLAFKVGTDEVAAIIRGKVFPNSSKKIQSTEAAPTHPDPTRSRTPDKDSDDPVNPYEGNNFEFINELLHNIYPTNHNGVIVRDRFNVLKANTDIANLKSLKKGSVEYDETNLLTEIWIQKIKDAVKAETDDFETFI